MANVRSSNTWYVDTTSSASDTSTFLSERNLKLLGLIYTVANTTDVIDLYDKNPSSAAIGSHKLQIKSATVGETVQLRLADIGIVFPNGVWVALTGTPTVTLLFTQAAGS